MKAKDVLSTKAYNKLLRLIPALLEWLRERDLLGGAKHCHVAALYMIDTSRTTEQDDAHINDILVCLAAEIDRGPLAKKKKKKGKPSNNPSNNVLHALLIAKAFDISLFYNVLLKIMISATPPLVPKSLRNLDMATNVSLSTNRDEFEKLQAALRKDFAFESLLVFAELCSLLRDSLSLSGGSDNLRSVASSVGRVLIGGANGEGSSLMQVFIKRCYQLFDFLPQKNANWQVVGSRMRLPMTKDTEMTRLLVYDKLRRDLVVFYEIKDSKLIPAVPLLMSSYSIYQLALGILIKYACLPLGWKEFLSQNKVRHELDWFVADNIVFVSEDIVVTKKKYYIPASAKKLYAEMKAKNRDDELNKITKELIQKKIDHVRCLEAVLNDFVSEIKFISQSEAFGREAKKALGITNDEINQIMGSPLKGVLEIEQRICADLESLSLLPCEVKQDFKRAGLMCKILLKHKEATIKAYSRYGINFEKYGDATLKNLLQRRGTTGADNINLHFEDVYEEIRRTTPVLTTSLEVILQGVIGYLTKIPLFIERMKKHIEKKMNSKHPSYSVIATSLPLYRSLILEVNNNIQAVKDTQQSNNSRKIKKAPSSNNFLGFTPGINRWKAKKKGALNVSELSLNG